MAASPWTFTQLGGAQKTLTLEGWSAPFGRPRKGAVVAEEVSWRASETYYQGSVTPTRHDFGDRLEPWTLKGRWMDQVLGPGGANARALDWKLFHADHQRIAIRWGEIVAYKGVLSKLKLERESSAHIAWSMYERPAHGTEPYYRAGLEFTDAAQQTLEEYCRRHCGDNPRPNRSR